MTGSAWRLFVGGPLDGRHITVEGAAEQYLYPVPRISRYDWTKSHLDIDTDVIMYTLMTAPTGERVFLAPGAVFDERFDTPEWVGLRAPELVDLEHVGPWIWRGRPTQPDGNGGKLKIIGMWTYITISPDGRYELRGRTTDAYVGDKRYARYGMQGDMLALDLQRQMAYNMLPTCPDFDCDQKASETVVRSFGAEIPVLYGEILGPRQRFALCPTHKALVLQLCPGLRSGRPALDTTEEPNDPAYPPYTSGRLALWGYTAAIPPVSTGNLFRNINVY